MLEREAALASRTSGVRRVTFPDCWGFSFVGRAVREALARMLPSVADAIGAP
jgi:hypothetical protein